MQRLTSGEPLQDVSDGLRIGMEGRDVAAHVFLGLEPEEIELRLVRPQDLAVWSDPMQGEGGPFGEIAELRLDGWDIPHSWFRRPQVGLYSGDGVQGAADCIHGV